VNADVETEAAPLHVIGAIRDIGLGKSALTVLFSGPIGDAELREFQDYISKWRVEKSQEPA